MFNYIDRLEAHLKSKAFTKEMVRALFPEVTIPDEAFDKPKEFCDKVRHNPLTYIEPDPTTFL